MEDMIMVSQKWPRVLVEHVRRIADSRHTTASEITRQAILREYPLPSTDGNRVHNDPNSVKASNGNTQSQEGGAS